MPQLLEFLCKQVIVQAIPEVQVVERLSRPQMAARSVTVPTLWRVAPQAKVYRFRDTRWEERGQVALSQESRLGPATGKIFEDRRNLIVDSPYCELRPNLDGNA